ELDRPWAHWMRDDNNAGGQLLSDFLAAHDANELYDGIPVSQIRDGDPRDLQRLVEDQGFENQPNVFDSRRIIDRGVTPEWTRLYQNAVQGLATPPPYHENRITDPAKLTAATQAYRSVISGAMPLSALPDI